MRDRREPHRLLDVVGARVVPCEPPRERAHEAAVLEQHLDRDGAVRVHRLPT
jgi:hypothetical protein